MANCYLCGKTIDPGPHLRRRVKTGDWVRRSYDRSRVTGYHVRYGTRTVCKSCAWWIDRRDWQSERLQWLQIIVGLVVLALILGARLFS